MCVSSQSWFDSSDSRLLSLLNLLLSWLCLHIDSSVCNSPHGDGSTKTGWKTKHTRLATHSDLSDLDIPGS